VIQKDNSKILRITRRFSERRYFCRAPFFDNSAKQQIDTSCFPHPLNKAACFVLRVSYMFIIGMTYMQIRPLTSCSKDKRSKTPLRSRENGVVVPVGFRMKQHTYVIIKYIIAFQKLYIYKLLLYSYIHTLYSSILYWYQYWIVRQNFSGLREPYWKIGVSRNHYWHDITKCGVVVHLSTAWAFGRTLKVGGSRTFIALIHTYLMWATWDMQ
jgi:hypothetical protein